MADDNLRQLVAQGLTALQAGSRIAEQATQDIRNAARDPQLRQALEEGSRVPGQWQDRIERALDQVGAEAEDRGNPILEAHYDVSRRIRDEAADDVTRDLGIIAAGQLALHYWIASFGTLRNYAAKLGLDGVDRDFRQCVEEAKQADEQHNQLAERLLREQAIA